MSLLRTPFSHQILLRNGSSSQKLLAEEEEEKKQHHHHHRRSFAFSDSGFERESSSRNRCGFEIMNSSSAQFVPMRRIEMYDSIHQIGMWGDNFHTSCTPNSLPSLIIEPQTNLDNQSEETSHGTICTSTKSQQETSRNFDKVQRRLAQNRKAARKSRLRKKAYVQQLEASRLKLMQIEQDFKQSRLPGFYVGSGLDPSNMAFSSSVNTGIAVFEMEYGQWIEEQNRQICELRNALNASLNDIELKSLVEGGMSHYFEHFRMKAVAARADVFYVMCGMWKTSSERFFQWIGGFRPSELLKVLVPQLDLDPLTEQQFFDICNLRQSCQQAEDALSQGMEKLQQSLAETVAFTQMDDGNYIPPMDRAIHKLEALISFIIQADHLRQETLQQMSRILTIRQAARCLLALGEYFQRLRALSSLWASHQSQDPV